MDDSLFLYCVCTSQNDKNENVSSFRFIVEDTKELLFRAEVQNRVYKRQIDAVDTEILRLENLLLHSPARQKAVGSPSSPGRLGKTKGAAKVSCCVETVLSVVCPCLDVRFIMRTSSSHI